MESSCESWRLAIEYEKRLRAEQRKKQAFDPSIRALRKSVREAYEQSLFEDYAFSQAHDVEQQLWKVCYYRPIEDFRKRIKEATATAAGAAPHGGVTAKEGAEQLPKVIAAYRTFLAEASVNYRLLAARLQAAYGNLGVDLQLEPGAMAQVAAYAAACSARTAGQRVDVRPSVHRALVFLGDLARYASQVPQSEPGQQKAEQARAVRYYQLAAGVMPSSGNPYNQLAVMAYLGKQELLSVYYYFRALGVSSPFLTARDNLLILFEHNRSRYASLAATPPGTVPSTGAISTRYVRLAGLLFDRINLETTADVRSAAAQGLRAALADPNFLAATNNCYPASSLLLQLATVLIFSAHGLAAGMSEATGATTSNADITQRPFLKRVALAALFEFTTCLCSAVTSLPAQQLTSNSGASNDTSGTTGLSLDGLLAALSVALSWLVSSSAEPMSTSPLHPANAVTATQVPADGSNVGPSPLRQNPLDEGGAAWHEVQTRAALLRAAARLAKVLHPLMPHGPGMHDTVMGKPAVQDGKHASGGSEANTKPAHQMLPEVKELLGFVPLAEAHNAVKQLGPGPLRSVGLGLPKSSSRAIMAGQMSVDSSTDTTGNNTHAVAMEVDGPAAAEDNDGQQQQQTPARQLRLQQVWFWLTSLGRKAGAASSSATTNLGQYVSALALQNLERATKELITVLQSLPANTEQAQQPHAPAAQPPQAKQAAPSQAQAAQHAGNGHAISSAAHAQKQAASQKQISALQQVISEQQVALQQGALQQASLQQLITQQQAALQQAALQPQAAPKQQARPQQPQQRPQQLQPPQECFDEAENEEQVVYQPPLRQQTATPPPQSPSASMQAAAGIKQPTPLVASHPLLSASTNTLANSSKRSSAVMDSPGAAATAAPTPAQAAAGHVSAQPHQDIPLPPPFPPSSFLSHLSHGSHSPRSAAPTMPPSPVAGAAAPQHTGGAASAGHGTHQDGRVAGVQAGTTMPPLAPHIQPSSKLMMRASITSTTSGPLSSTHHTAPATAGASLQPAATPVTPFGTTGPDSGHAMSAPAPSTAGTSSAPPPPKLPSTVSPTMAAAARVLLPQQQQQHSDPHSAKQPAAAGPAVPAAALAAARAAAAAAAAQLQQGMAMHASQPSMTAPQQQLGADSAQASKAKAGGTGQDGPLPPAPHTSTAVANVLAAARQGLQQPASPPQPGPSSPSMAAAAVAGAVAGSSVAQRAASRPKLSMSAMDMAGPGKSSTPSPTTAASLPHHAPPQQQQQPGAGGSILSGMQAHLPYQPSRTTAVAASASQPLLSYAPHMNQPFNRFSQPAQLGQDSHTDGGFMINGTNQSNRYYADAMASRALEVTALSTVNQLGLSQSPAKDDHHAGLAGAVSVDRITPQPYNPSAAQTGDAGSGGWLGTGRSSMPAADLGNTGGSQGRAQEASLQGFGHAGVQQARGTSPGLQYPTGFLLQSASSMPQPVVGGPAARRPPASAASAQQLGAGLSEQPSSEFGTAGFTFLDMLREEPTGNMSGMQRQQQAPGQVQRGATGVSGSLLATAAAAAMMPPQHQNMLSRGSHTSHTQPHSGSSTRHSSGHHMPPTGPSHITQAPQHVEHQQQQYNLTGHSHQQPVTDEQQLRHHGHQQHQQGHGLLPNPQQQQQQHSGPPLLSRNSEGLHATNSWQYQNGQWPHNQQPCTELSHHHTQGLPHHPMSAPMAIDRHQPTRDAGHLYGVAAGLHHDMLSTGGESGGWGQTAAAFDTHPHLPQLPNSLEL